MNAVDSAAPRASRRIDSARDRRRVDPGLSTTAASSRPSRRRSRATTWRSLAMIRRCSIETAVAGSAARQARQGARSSPFDGARHRVRRRHRRAAHRLAGDPAARGSSRGSGRRRSSTTNTKRRCAGTCARERTEGSSRETTVRSPRGHCRDPNSQSSILDSSATGGGFAAPSRWCAR